MEHWNACVGAPLWLKKYPANAPVSQINLNKLKIILMRMPCSKMHFDRLFGGF
jgi:hypothetical protein